MGWPDAPKHVCRIKTKAGLVFCCPQKKTCPARDECLKEFGISDEAYRKIKESFEAEFGNEKDIDVCFGSLVWCCKASRMCARRDRALEKIGMNQKEYMALKKKMSLKFENPQES